MTNEQAFFLRVLRDYLFDLPTDPDPTVDETKLVAWAEAHELGGIFYVQYVRQIRNKELRKRLNTEFGSAVSHSTNLNADYAELSATLKGAGIPYLPVKGILIAPFYPDPELRTMGDVDLLIHAEDAERVRDLLTPLGCRVEAWAKTEWHYRRSSVRYEFQSLLMDAEAPDIGDINAYFNNFWTHAQPDGENAQRLDPNFHFLYLIGHIAKHLRWIGVGFRQFFDLAVLMTRREQPYDWDWIRREAERIGFFRFTECCLAFNERWFGVPSPYGADCLSDELFESVTQKIFQDGVFGFENEMNRLHKLEKYSRDSKAPLLLARIRAAKKLMFPPYRDLIVSEKYAALRGKPWLLPLYWFRRGLRNKASLRNGELDAVLHASGQQVRERRQQLIDLGLSK